MAIRKLRFGGDPDFNVGAAIRNDNGEIWNGSEMVEETAGVLTYAAETPVPETGAGSMYYMADVPADLPPGSYHISYIDLDSGDMLFQSIVSWDGGSIVDDLVTGESKAAICNMSLSHLGIGTTITTLETDTSQEAIALNLFYDTALSKALRDFPWPFALRYADPALVDTDPTDEWGYAYRKPSNALYIRRFLSGIRTDVASTRTPFRMGGDDTGGLIYCDYTSPQIEYIALITNPLMYPPDFILAFSYLLASYVAPRLSGIDSKLGERARLLYEHEMNLARANAANEESLDVPHESSFILERE